MFSEKATKKGTKFFSMRSQMPTQASFFGIAEATISPEVSPAKVSNGLPNQADMKSQYLTRKAAATAVLSQSSKLNKRNLQKEAPKGTLKKNLQELEVRFTII